MTINQEQLKNIHNLFKTKKKETGSEEQALLAVVEEVSRIQNRQCEDIVYKNLRARGQRTLGSVIASMIRETSSFVFLK